MDVDWADLLKQTRAAGQLDCNQVCSRLPILKDLIEKYNDVLETSKIYSKEEKKRYMLNVRAALRLALTWSSADDFDLRNKFINEAVTDLAIQKPLLNLVANQKGAAKCRVMASQLLSNLVTSHAVAAAAISLCCPISPSQDSIAARIREKLTYSEMPCNRDGAQNIHLQSSELNWVDIILSCAHTGNREALAGIAAVMHNAIVSLQQVVVSSKDVNPFAHRLATDSTWVNSLLRNIISVQAAKPAGNKEKGATTGEEKAPCDSATEWISLLLLKCCRLGLLPDLVSSISGHHENQTAASGLQVVPTPEHIVLLHCVQSEVEMAEGPDVTILGGECGTEAVTSTHLFLARVYSELRKGVEINNLHLSVGSDEPEDALRLSGIFSVIDILACSLVHDTDAASMARVELGKEKSMLIQEACKDLGAVIDSLSQRNKGAKNRDFVVNDEEKRFMTSLVRLLGNVCFHCQQNQDLVRSTTVQDPARNISASGAERNGLHVMLSCTSLSHACFTLREWAVIAIRNVLDHNEVNQAEVAGLQAREPVQTAALANLGIKVSLDPTGNVSVVPADRA